MFIAFCAVAAANVMFSLVSLIASSTVGTRTIKSVMPAGTLTVVPIILVKVRPLSNETCSGVLVSVPRIAVPEDGVSVTVVGVVLGVTVMAKSKLPPSIVFGLPTAVTAGLSSSPPGPVPVAPVPSSLIVVVMLPVPIVALVGTVRLTAKFSEPS